MEQPERTRQAAGHAPFQARIASVALVTTVAVLLAACVTFMLQQWAVSVQESRVNATAMNAVVADIAAPALAAGDVEAARRAVAALDDAPGVRSASLIDARGRILATREDAGARPGGASVTTPVMIGGRAVGALVTRVERPTLAALAPRYIALTLALFFGAAGLAMFLATVLARRVIEPVNRLSRAMERGAESGAFVPVAEEADDDLFRSLARSFNQLLGRLEANDRDLRRTLDDLVVARDQAQAANVLKSQFLANMSHEIRTPLNGVLAMADVMERDGLDARQREHLAVIRDSGELLLGVINDVLDLSKIEAGRLELSEQDFSLRDLAETACRAFAVLAGQKGLRFAMAIDADAEGWWRGDPDRIRQVLSNLLSNAVKFTDEGVVTARFTRAPGGGLRVTIADTGVGIATDKIPTLFEKFVQADNSTTRRFGGTGLGLAISRELVQLMGGRVAVRSAEGEGSTFTFELPLRRASAPVAAPAAAPDLAPTGPERRVRILAAEDNATNQKVLQALLEPMDVELHIAADGREAVDAWHRGEFDLVLMDIQMPEMDGVEAARTIRAAEAASRLPRTPILALTANALVHQVESYLAAGMDGHIAKPIELRRLYDAINAALAPADSPDAMSAAPVSNMNVG